MGKETQLVKIARFNTKLNQILETSYSAFAIYRSKGLLAHLLKRKHYAAAKYLDALPDMIMHPDYVGIYNSNIEMVKCYKDSIFVCIKLDSKKNRFYVATMFDIKQAKLDHYVKSGRLKKVIAS